MYVAQRSPTHLYADLTIEQLKRLESLLRAPDPKTTAKPFSELSSARVEPLSRGSDGGLVAGRKQGARLPGGEQRVLCDPGIEEAPTRSGSSASNPRAVTCPNSSSMRSFRFLGKTRDSTDRRRLIAAAIP